jgi:hypothetical protein
MLAVLASEHNDATPLVCAVAWLHAAAPLVLPALSASAVQSPDTLREADAVRAVAELCDRELHALAIGGLRLFLPQSSLLSYALMHQVWATGGFSVERWMVLTQAVLRAGCAAIARLPQSTPLRC